jgi:hypothetical protein
MSDFVRFVLANIWANLLMRMKLHLDFKLSNMNDHVEFEPATISR